MAQRIDIDVGGTNVKIALVSEFLLTLKAKGIHFSLF